MFYNIIKEYLIFEGGRVLKKIRVTVPEDIWYIMKIDQKISV